MKKIITLLLTFSLSIFYINLSAENITITDSDLNGNTTYNWTSDNVYTLEKIVFLEAGGVLNIEAGTAIKGKAGQGENAAALVITRGAKIYANGTADQPIIFTSEIDDLNDPFDLEPTDRGFWGGLIILGNGILGADSPEKQIEGIQSGESRAAYGGTDNADDSGILRYVSIRHGGTDLGDGDEINGLTLGGVGSGTTMEYIEVFANNDDGIEWFGGAATIKYASVAFCKDDSYDYDLGWVGKGQFLFTIQSPDASDSAGEHDGANPDGAAVFSNPTIYNATYIGAGTDNTSAKNSFALLMRDATGGTYANSIFTDFANHALEVEDLPAADGVDSRQRMENGELVLKNNIWFGFGAGDQLNASDNGILNATESGDDIAAQFLIDHLTNNSNTLENPNLGGISRASDQNLDPRPDAVATQNLATYPNDNFFEAVDYKGAFGVGKGLWTNGWTALDAYGFTKDLPSEAVGIEAISDQKNQAISLRPIVPNPAKNWLQVAFETSENETISLHIYDLNGRLIQNLSERTFYPKGTHTLPFDTQNLDNGIYFFSLKTSNTILTKKLVINKF